METFSYAEDEVIALDAEDRVEYVQGLQNAVVFGQVFADAATVNEIFARAQAEMTPEQYRKFKITTSILRSCAESAAELLARIENGEFSCTLNMVVS